MRLEERPLPEPGPGQIRVRVSVCGVCHTDLHIVEGDLLAARYPITPGHQIVGGVEKRGQGAERFTEGARVGVPWLNWTDGECEFCRRGEENLCRAAQFTGQHADGGYAEYVVVDERFALSLPALFSDAEAAPLLCAGIVGYRSLKKADLEPGERLGLVGFGASAHISIQVARYWDCPVSVMTRAPEHRRHALELGAEWAGGIEDTPPAELDRCVIFAPAGWLVPLALAKLRPGGTLALNAAHMSPLPQMDYSLIYGERTVRSVANATRQDGEEFLKLAAEIPVRTEIQVLPLDAANEVLSALKRSEVKGAAVLEINR